MITIITITKKPKLINYNKNTPDKDKTLKKYQNWTQHRKKKKKKKESGHQKN